MEDCSNNQNVNGDRLIGSDSNSYGPVDCNSLKLNLGAEFDDWQEFVEAVDEFQKRTLIKLTITTSRRVRDEEDEDDPTEEEAISPLNGNPVNEIQINSINRKRKFEYKYIKLTCKHYGSYRSTSKGIRPNQATRKIKCPTYIYASLDHYRQRLVIKQMKVSCNHELKDEPVLLPKLLKFSPCLEPPSSSNESSDCSPTVSSSSIRTLRNRKVLKVPLWSSVNALLSVGRIRCNHKPQDVCQASRLTADDLTAIQSKFSSLNKKDQDDLLSNWIKVEKDVTVNKLEQPNPLQLLIHLPTINGNLLPLCCDTFIHILSIPIQRINDLICEQLKKTSHREISIQVVKESQHHNTELETCAATILHSLSKETHSNDDQIYSINLNHDLNRRPNQNDWTEPTLSHNLSLEMDTFSSPVNEITSENQTKELSSMSSPRNNQESKEIVDSPSLTNNLLMDTNNQLSTFNYPSIKVSQIVNGFSVDIDCEFEMSLQGVSLINNSKTVKLIIGPE